MRPTQFPRFVVIILLILLATAFLAGNVLAFSSVQAAPTKSPSPTLPAATGSPSATPSVTPEPVEIIPSADTTGILILGILLFVIILIGLLWGSRRLGRK